MTSTWAQISPLLLQGFHSTFIPNDLSPAVSRDLKPFLSDYVNRSGYRLRDFKKFFDDSPPSASIKSEEARTESTLEEWSVAEAQKRIQR